MQQQVIACPQQSGCALWGCDKLWAEGSWEGLLLVHPLAHELPGRVTEGPISSSEPFSHPHFKTQAQVSDDFL